MTVSLLTWASRASERLLADHWSSRLIVNVKVASRMSENWQSLLNKVPEDMHTSHTKCRSLFQDDWGIANDVGITNYNGKDFPKNIWRGEGLIWLYCWLSTKDWLIEIEKCVLLPEASWFLELKNTHGVMKRSPVYWDILDPLSNLSLEKTAPVSPYIDVSLTTCSVSSAWLSGYTYTVRTGPNIS